MARKFSLIKGIQSPVKDNGDEVARLNSEVVYWKNVAKDQVRIKQHQVTLISKAYKEIRRLKERINELEGNEAP